MKNRVLFLCTGNSCRSQMAEGFGKKILGDKFEIYSAGVETHGLNPNAVKVMKELEIDITDQTSDNVKKYLNCGIDFVVTVCDNAKESCPVFPESTKVVSVSFQDPPALAKEVEKNGGSEEDQLDCYRRVRDEIKKYVENLPNILK
ncbi:MAG: arsenate reductase [Candidatus Cloacimonadota bacterium]|nr:MAG: arsenate reductase [Candidatus Cloacimonadota bacterium]PIE79040.1 MAG: arsenate reductase [Candidatus Delongbacteria bacterium]